jgi:DNA-binding NarL/FixJ family response regulator
MKKVIMANIPVLTRELTAFEHHVMGLLCDGLTNSAIARSTGHSEKVIENTVSRTAGAFNLKSDRDTNVRVMVALAYRAQFGDAAFEKFGIDCQWVTIDMDGTRTCNRHV